MAFAKKVITSVTPDLFRKIIDSVNTRIIDMQDVVYGIVLAILSGGKLADGRLYGEHLFMIGPPGVGKTYVMDLIRRCIDIPDKLYFDYLMNLFSVPEEIIGSVDMKTLMEKHVMRRKLNGFLAKAVFAVIDEIWKSGPVTTTLFKITNERVYRNGSQMVKCPLISMLSASNEYPANKMDAPLWDRILFRYFVTPVEGKENWMRIDKIDQTPWNPPLITLDQIMDAKGQVLQVEIPQEVHDAIYGVHTGLQHMGVELSPRRRKKMWNVVRANAWLQGRTKAIITDVSAIWPCCWREDREIANVKKLIVKTTNFELDKLMTKFDVAYKLFHQGVPFMKKYDDTKMEVDLGEIDQLEEKLGELKVEFEEMESKIASGNKDEHDKMLSVIRGWHREMLPYAMKKAEQIS